MLWGIAILLPWNVVLNEFVFFLNEMNGYSLSPLTTYPFAVNGLLAVSQIYMIFFGHKFSLKFKVQVMFITGAIICIVLPFLTHLVGNVAAKFWAVFFVLLIYGPVNGVV